MNVDAEFSRRLLTEVHKTVRKHFPRINLKIGAWVYSYGKTWEFHGPDKFYWHGRAGNAFEARCKGWEAYLKSKGIEE